MSALIGPAKAARILGDQFDRVATESHDPDVKVMMLAMSLVHHRAADKMDQTMRDESNAFERLRRGAEILRQGGQS